MQSLRLIGNEHGYTVIDEQDERCRIELHFKTYEEAVSQLDAWVNELQDQGKGVVKYEKYSVD